MKSPSDKSAETTFFKIAFAFSVLMLFAIAYISFRQLSEVNNAQKRIIHSRERQLEIEKLFSIVKDAERMQRGYIISGNKKYYTNYNNSRKKIAESFQKLEKFKNSRTLTRQDIDSLHRMIAIRYELMDDIVKLYPPASASAEVKKTLEQGAAQMHDIESFINKKINSENIILNKYKAYHRQKNRFLPFTTGLLVVFSLLIFFISFYKVYKETIRNRKINEQLLIINKSFKYAEEISQIGHWKRYPDSDFIEWSDNLYRIFGIEPGSQRLTEKKLLDFVHPDDKEAVRETLHKVRSEHKPPRLTYRIVLNDGTIKYLKTAGKLVSIEDTPLIIGTTCDVTSQIEMYTSLEEKNKELQAAVEELASFNHIASHDLQEPLRKIQMFISRINAEEAGAFSDSGREYFERITVSALRMEQLIDDLLLYSQTNKDDHVFVQTDLNMILQQAQQELIADAESKKAVITSDILPTLLVIPFQMRQLFVNLLSNSLKYSIQDIPSQINIVTTTVNAKYDKLLPDSNRKYYKITFTDNGIGFKQEFAEKIFILFQRLHKKENYSGTGIGLAICKKIIENHNGYIFAESTPGEGASFHIYLPVQESCLM